MTQQQATKTLDVHLSNYRQVEDELPGRDAEWVRQLRADAIRAYEEQGWPTTDQEAWKYTSLKEVKKLDFQSAPRLDPGTVDAAELAPYRMEGLDAIELVFVNGYLDDELSDLDRLPDGVTVTNLASALEDDPSSLEDDLGRYADVEEHPFAALNTASFRDGALVDVPANTVVEAPIHVFYVSRAGDQPLVTHPRTLVRAGRSSEVDVIESFLGIGEGPLFTNGVTEIVADDNATVRHVKLQRESSDTTHIWSFQGHQSRDSNVRSHNLIFGAGLTRNHVYDLLDEAGCDTTLNGLYLGTGDQHIDNYTQMRHDDVGGTSHQLYKGVLDDSSRGVFRGTIYVAPGAQKTDGYQHNPNLLLSDGAMANSIPQLEIFADDVKCSHGSTTGEMSDEWMFYLKARGLDEETARDLLVYAFAGEVIEQIEIEPVRETVRDLVLDRLTKGDAVREAI